METIGLAGGNSNRQVATCLPAGKSQLGPTHYSLFIIHFIVQLCQKNIIGEVLASVTRNP